MTKLQKPGKKNFSKENSQKSFVVEFHGKFIPLQGVPCIILAAEKLKIYSDIQFVLIGSGQTFAESQKLAQSLSLTNVEFITRVPYAEISGYIENADVCLGIFGQTDKTKRVIPNKIYESVALGKAVITSDTPAIREVFRDGEDILLCKVADALDLSIKILELRNDYSLRKKIENNAIRLYNEALNPKKIVSDLRNNLESLIT